MRERAYLYIQRKIASGELRAGQAVSELALAKELGTSRTPIREALGQLVGEGFLDQTPNRGTIVVQFNRQDVVELFEFREALEVFAVGKAARFAVPASDRGRLQTLVDEILALRQELDRSGLVHLDKAQHQRYITSDIGFHALLIRLAQNGRILKVVNETRLLIRIFAMHGPPHGPELELTHQHHSAVLQAVIVGDQKRAMELVGVHIKESLQARLDEFDQMEREASLRKNDPLLLY